MSRIGKNPVIIPQGVTVTREGDLLSAKGKLGSLEVLINPLTEVTIDGDRIYVKPAIEKKEAHMMWGTAKKLIENMIQGVHEGFKVELEIQGVGYRAAVQGKDLTLTLGFSHEVVYPIPDSLTIKCAKPTEILIEGIDRQLVGQVASEIRAYRPPEPYKGKGVRYKGEQVNRKEGKKK